MYLKWIITAIFYFMLANAAFAEVRGNNYPIEREVAPFFKSGREGVYLGYYSGTGDKGALHIDNKSAGWKGREIIFKTGEKRSTFFDIFFVEDGMLVFWRPKTGDAKKYVYVQKSMDGGKTFNEASVLNSTTDALLPAVAVTDGNKKFYAVWVDERDHKHRLYMNYSLDGGGSFLGKDILLTPGFSAANLPSLLLKDNRLDLFFIGTKEGTGNAEIYYVFSEDAGKTWSEIRAIASIADWTPYILIPARAGNRMTLFWGGIEGIYGAYSADGKTWEKISSFDEAAGKDVNRLAAATHGSSIYITASWAKRFDKNAKADVYFYKSEDAGSTWEGPKKLNTNKYASTNSWFPAMQVSKDGRTVLAAWRDHRDIRGSIYINYSKDGGKTWLNEDLSVEEKPGKYLSVFPSIAEYKDKFYVQWFRYGDDSMGDADIYMEEVKIK